MKSYVIRSKIWRYNDQSYDYCGADCIGSTFSAYDAALTEKRKLEREFLVQNFDGIYRFEVGEDTLEYNEKRRFKINKFLYDNLNFNATILLGWSSYKNEMFDEKPSDLQLDKLVDEIAAYQYKLVEYPDSNSFLVYTAKINKLYVRRQINIEIWGEGKPRIFLSKEEALEYMLISEEFRWEKVYFNQISYFEKKLTELSDFPVMLSDLVAGSSFLSYEDGRLNINYKCDNETLGKLFKLLKEPILLFDKRKIEDDDLVNYDGKYRYFHINKIWKSIEERNSRFKSKSEYLVSSERLEVFKIELYVWNAPSDYFPYSQIIKNHLEKTFEIKAKNYSENLQIEGTYFRFYGVISELVKTDEYNVKIHIKTVFDPEFNMNWVGIGVADDIKTAFTLGVENWINTYGDLWNDRLRKIIDNPPSRDTNV